MCILAWEINPIAGVKVSKVSVSKVSNVFLHLGAYA